LNKRVVTWLVICIMVLGSTGCAKQGKTRYSAEFLELFNTATKIIGYTDTKEEFEGYVQLIFDNLKEYHELYDIYNDYEGINNLKTINDNAGIKPVKVDKRIIDLLVFSKDVHKLTNGKVNIAFGAVLEVWHEYRTEGIENPDMAKIPPMELLEELSAHTDINKMIINEEESTVFLEDSEMSLDVGGIAKGYATERVSEIAEQNGFTSALLSVGGNVRSIGTRYEKEKFWNVGVQNPDMDSEEENLAILNLSNMSLVSSGVYQRYYTVEGKQYHHIIDSDTLMPSDYFTAVSIVCKDSGMADALSTGVFNMSFEDGLKLINGLEDTEAIWILKDGSMKYSSNFEDFIK
jgi:thiamine biosynthesis lipoprotein